MTWCVLKASCFAHIEYKGVLLNLLAYIGGMGQQYLIIAMDALQHRRLLSNPASVAKLISIQCFLSNLRAVHSKKLFLGI